MVLLIIEDEILPGPSINITTPTRDGPVGDYPNGMRHET
jgi:hypothetical protein